jgi:hypothetical protein
MSASADMTHLGMPSATVLEIGFGWSVSPRG